VVHKGGGHLVVHKGESQWVVSKVSLVQMVVPLKVQGPFNKEHPKQAMRQLSRLDKSGRSSLLDMTGKLL